MIHLDYETTYRETIEGPLPLTKGSPFGDRLWWKIAAGALTGPRIDAKIAIPGTDWMRLGADGIRRQNLRAQFVTDDGATIEYAIYEVG